MRSIRVEPRKEIFRPLLGMLGFPFFVRMRLRVNNQAERGFICLVKSKTCIQNRKT